MPILAELYVATRTRNTANADTENLPVLVVKRGPDIVFTKPLFGGDFRTARGAGAVWRFDVREVNLDSADLSVQLWASGDDAWSPEHVIAWGVAGNRIGDERVIPLAAFLDLASPVTPAGSGVWISGHMDKGERILFVPSVDRGRDATRARRLIVISATEAYGGMFPAAAGPGGNLEETGTVGPLTLQGGGAGRLFLSYTLPATPQGDLGHGAAAFYVVDLAAPFSRSDLEGGAFTLTIGSEDWWKPDYFAVFGVDTVNAGPRALIPFVAASAFELRQMSSDPSEGWHSVVLPTAKVLPQRPIRPDVDIDDVEGVLAARIPHAEDQQPIPERRMEPGANSET
ncbi:hypothetical protein AA309_26340 [Microvirga vignae]|uniref:Uncharacterized protein n=2 Tax=Microvirga vignae TaxID=1225564 RepID=A0A0H1R6A4_9HYPH|nr:hypothetical protein AA309_26340 [Microvirga vignae]